MMERAVAPYKNRQHAYKPGDILLVRPDLSVEQEYLHIQPILNSNGDCKTYRTRAFEAQAKLAGEYVQVAYYDHGAWGDLYSNRICIERSAPCNGAYTSLRSEVFKDANRWWFTEDMFLGAIDDFPPGYDMKEVDVSDDDLMSIIGGAS